MQQTLVLENKLGEFISDETTNFVNRIYGYVSDNSSFNFDAYHRTTALYNVLHSEAYRGTSFHESQIDWAKPLIDDAVEYLSIEGHKYTNVNTIDTFGIGQFSATINEDVISANNMDLVVLLQNNKKVKKQSLFSEEDLKYQEKRRKRKVRKLTFEER